MPLLIVFQWNYRTFWLSPESLSAYLVYRWFIVMDMRSTLVLRTLAAFSLLALVASPQEQSASENASSENWLTYGGNYAAWRCSKLVQINRANVKNLVPVWAF